MYFMHVRVVFVRALLTLDLAYYSLVSLYRMKNSVDFNVRVT